MTNFQWILHQLRTNPAYDELKRLDDLEDSEYKATYMRDVKDTLGLRYVIAVDVYERGGKELNIQPFCVFTHPDEDVRVEIEGASSLSVVEENFARTWEGLGKHYEERTLN